MIMSPLKIFSGLIMFLALLLAMNMTAYSQTKDSKVPLSSKEAIESHKYIELDVKNLMHVYWALRDIEIDNTTIDQYLMLTECKIYQDYYNNDIKWHKIRKATRSYLNSIRDNFPRTLYFVIPVDFKRYDVEAQKFALTKSSIFENAYEISITAKPPLQSKYCEDLEFEELNKTYPHQVVLSLNSPFSLSYIEMPPDKAQRLISKVFSQNKNERRTVFLKFYVTLNDFRGFGQDKDSKYSFIDTNLDKIELYESPELTSKVVDVDRTPNRAGAIRESFK